MKRVTMLLTGLVASAVTAVGGCASNGGGHGGHADSQGMMCPTCETVWVAPKGAAAGSKVQAMTWGRGMVCPDCDAMAKAYFKDGQSVLHDCPTCKVAPRPTTTHTPTHPKGTHT
jgi:hypothetical protein